MRRALIVVLLLYGCGQSASEKANSDVDFLVKHGGSSAELCDAYTRLVDAYREERKAKEWNGAKLFQRINCRAANLGT